MYKAEMILRNRYESSTFIKLLERVKNTNTPMGAYIPIGWRVMFYDNWRNKWGDGSGGIAWLNEEWLTDKYEPIGRLAELVMFGVNHV